MQDLPLLLGDRLQIPLRALRAALEEVQNGNSDASVLSGAIDSVARLSSAVDAMRDLVDPPPLAPAACTSRHVAGAVRDLLGACAEKLLLAHEGPPVPLFLDAAVLSRCLVRILRGPAQRDPGPAMLHVTSDARRCRLVLVSRVPGSETPRSRLDANSAGQFGLTLALVARDLTRVGAESAFRMGSDGLVTTELLVKAESAEREAA